MHMTITQALTSLVFFQFLLTACAATVQPGSTGASTVDSSPATEEPSAIPTPTREAPPPSGAEREFRTDFSRHSVDYSEILSGGPPKDGIPAIDDPLFDTVAVVDKWLQPQEPVILVHIGDDARAYPLQVLVWHEIVNDVVSGVPVLVTFCPLCNTAIAFERTVDGRVLEFGTTGRLRYSNLILYDRQTETWWQQANGEAIAGELTGTTLDFVPAAIIAWSEFKTSFPDGKVLSTDTGYSRAYGQNPYVGYDDIDNSPFLYRGPEPPDQLRPMTRVLAIEANDDAVAITYSVLEELRVVNETVGGEDVVIFWQPGTASALDSSAIAFGRDVGSANAFSRLVQGRSLSFAFDGSTFVDEQTGSRWDILGTAIEGELAGQHLSPIVSINHFWFSWVAFQPGTRVYRP
jgi:hypothetical protein